ncbi:hypothetical protein KKF34_00715 [Myxococcota bacterium]|nr:hypothetical protein [Myxococcota bacterium]MBU1382911.1 hypothetical protein [Myxococcota bacterium]MBU1495383.1 hypothetical protein [Myxococcota bacterium]
MNIISFLFILSQASGPAPRIKTVHFSGVMNKKCNADTCRVTTGAGSRAKFLIDSKTVVISDENASFRLTKMGVVKFEAGYFNVYTVGAMDLRFGDVTGKVASQASFKVANGRLCMISGALTIGKNSISTGRCISTSGVDSVLKAPAIFKKITLLSTSGRMFRVALNFMQKKGFSMGALFGNSGGEGATSSSAGMCLNDSSSSSAGNVGTDNQTVIKPPPMTKVTVVIPGGLK